MSELGYAQFAWLAAVIFGAFVVRGMSGFGAGMIAVPLLAFVIPLQLAVPLCSLLVFVLFVILLIRDHRQVVWPELWLLVPPTIIGAVLGLWLFAVLDNRVLVTMLGGFLVLYSLYMLTVSFLGLPQLRCSTRWSWPAGFFGSFFDTLFGGGYAWSGFYDRTVMLLFAALLPLMWAGTVAGERLGNKVNSETFARVLAVMLLASGLSLLAK